MQGRFQGAPWGPAKTPEPKAMLTLLPTPRAALTLRTHLGQTNVAFDCAILERVLSSATLAILGAARSRCGRDASCGHPLESEATERSGLVPDCEPGT